MTRYDLNLFDESRLPLLQCRSVMISDAINICNNKSTTYTFGDLSSAYHLPIEWVILHLHRWSMRVTTEPFHNRATTWNSQCLVVYLSVQDSQEMNSNLTSNSLSDIIIILTLLLFQVPVSIATLQYNINIALPSAARNSIQKVVIIPRSLNSVWRLRHFGD